MIKEKATPSRSESLLAIIRSQMFYAQSSTSVSLGLVDSETMKLLQLYLEDERLAKVLASPEKGPDKLQVKREDLENATKCAAELAQKGLPITMVSTDEMLDINDIFEILDPSLLKLRKTLYPWEARVIVALTYLSTLPKSR